MIKFNLAVLLAERGLKMSDIIKDTGIAKTTIRSLFYNTSQGIQLNTLETLCDYLQVEPGDIIAYHPIKFELDRYDYNDGFVYFDLTLTPKKNRTIKGEVDAEYYTTKHEPVDEYDEVQHTVEIIFYYSPNIYEEIKKIPTLFSKSIEDDLVEEVLDVLDLNNVTDLYISSDIMDYRDVEDD